MKKHPVFQDAFLYRVRLILESWWTDYLAVWTWNLVHQWWLTFVYIRILLLGVNPIIARDMMNLQRKSWIYRFFARTGKEGNLHRINGCTYGVHCLQIFQHIFVHEKVWKNNIRLSDIGTCTECKEILRFWYSSFGLIMQLFINLTQY